MSDSRTDHWENVYQSKPSTEVSWFLPHLEISLELLNRAGLNTLSRIVDIGAGASTLVDDLLALGVEHIAALDLSSAALAVAQHRLGPLASKVDWIVGDASRHPFAPNSLDFWHDRAVLHFLVDESMAAEYVANAARAVKIHGYAVIGGFASDGPTKCSGLPVARREPEEIAALFGSSFTLIAERRETHQTPWGAPQSFAYALLQKQGSPGNKQ